MTRVLAIARVTIYGLIGRRRSIGLILLGLIPALILAIYGLTETRAGDLANRETREFFRQGILPMVLGVTVPITALVLAAASLGDERQQKTISYIAMRPIRREAIAASKLVAAWISAFLIAGLGALATALVFGWAADSWDEIPAILVATAVTTLGFVAVFQVVGFVTDRAVIIGLGYLLIWEGIVTGAASQVATTSLWRIGASAYAGIVAGEHWGRSTQLLGSEVVADLEDLLSGVNPGAGGAITKVVVLALISIVVTGYLMRERDLVG